LEMGRRSLSILLLVLVACTAKRVSNATPPSSSPSSPLASVRIRTTLDMEVGPSVHPGSFRAAGRLGDASGAPVVGAIVKVTIMQVGGGASSAPVPLGTRTTDANGDFQVTFHAPQKGSFLVEARFAGDQGRLPSDDQGPIVAT
jgi:hypothetical protein